MQKTYDEMWQNASKRIQRGQADIDPLIDDIDDSRRGLSLILRPSQCVLNEFASFLEDAKELESGQHFYALNEIHSTVMSIVTCVPGFDLNQIHVPSYVDTIERSLSEIREFDIQYAGITASSNCVMVRGFPTGTGLDDLRERLRENFSDSDLHSSIDQRYSISTAHSTLIRFREKLNDADNFLTFLDGSRQIIFGKSRVSKMHLVFNDWYHRENLTRELYAFQLLPGS